jgi:hypothetical protein
MYTVEQAVKILGEVLNVPVKSTDYRPMVGSTGYLDTWFRADVPHCVSFGNDQRGRSFIVFRHPREDGYVCVYQWYADDNKLWTCTSSGVMARTLDEQVTRIVQFLQNDCELRVPGHSVTRKLYALKYQD